METEIMKEKKGIRKWLVFGIVLVLVAVAFAGVPMNVGAKPGNRGFFPGEETELPINLTIKVTGTKGTTAIMMMYEFESNSDDPLDEFYDNFDGEPVQLGTVTVVREPGAPNTGSFPATINLTNSYALKIDVEPADERGANPLTLDMALPNGKVKSLHHTFNDKHGWSWIIPDRELKEMLGHGGGYAPGKHCGLGFWKTNIGKLLGEIPGKPQVSEVRIITYLTTIVAKGVESGDTIFIGGLEEDAKKALGKRTLTKIHRILNNPNPREMKDKAEAHLWALMLSAEHMGDDFKKSDLYILNLGLGVEYEGTVEGGIDYLLDLYDDGNYKAVKNVSEHMGRYMMLGHDYEPPAYVLP
jgi:hypothetical protein